MGQSDQQGGADGDRDGRRRASAGARRGSGAPGRRDVVLAKKRARVDLLDRLGEAPGGGDQLAAMRLLAEVDLALSEHRGRPRSG